jgi:hypothetical protein
MNIKKDGNKLESIKSMMSTANEPGLQLILSFLELFDEMKAKKGTGIANKWMASNR